MSHELIGGEQATLSGSWHPAMRPDGIGDIQRDEDSSRPDDLLAEAFLNHSPAVHNDFAGNAQISDELQGTASETLPDEVSPQLSSLDFQRQGQAGMHNGAESIESQMNTAPEDERGVKSEIPFFSIQDHSNHDEGNLLGSQEEEDFFEKTIPPSSSKKEEDLGSHFETESSNNARSILKPSILDDDLDYASIFNRTNSFPEVPQLQQPAAVAVPFLPKSQAEQVLQRDDELHESHDSASFGAVDSNLDSSEHAAIGSSPEEQDNEIYANSSSMQTGRNVSSLADEEARFEEGLPLISQENVTATQLPQSVYEVPRDGRNDDMLQRDHPRHDMQEGRESPASSPPLLDRKSTTQVLDSMLLTTHKDVGLFSDDSERMPIAGSMTREAMAAPAHTTEPQVLADDLFPEPSASKEDDLAAMWEAALGEDELLEENENLLDPTSFFEDDDEGFLDEDTNDLTTEMTKGTKNTVAPTFPGLDPKTETKTQRQAYLPTSNERVPARNEHVQSRTQGQPSSISSYDQSRYAPNNPKSLPTSASMPSIQPYRDRSMQASYTTDTTVQTQTAAPAQSFADKSKGGYTSPYDLPMDISRTKKRNQYLQSSMNNLPQNSQSRPPPPRSSSMFTGAPPRINPQAPSPHVPKLENSLDSQVASSSASKSKANGFFEELPASKPRPSTSSGKYAPQPSSQTPPPLPPQLGRHGEPSRIPQQDQANSSPPLQPYQLLPPEKLSLFGTTPSQPTGRQSTPLANTRYSPAPVQASNVAPPQGRYAASPAAPAYVAAAPTPPILPFQPRTSSPLAQSALPKHSPSDHSIHSGGLTAQQVAYSSRPIARTFSPPNARRPPNTSHLSESAGHNASPPRDSRSVPLSDSHSSSSQVVATPETDRSDYSPLQRNSYEPAQPKIGVQARTMPRRSQTQSPGATRLGQTFSAESQALLQRPASANKDDRYVTDPSTMSLPSKQQQQQPPPPQLQPQLRGRGYSQRGEYMVPTDGRETDVLQRWRGCPLVVFGFGGNIVTSFPKQIPRYAAGQKTPMIKCSAGEINLRSAQSFGIEDSIGNFPGPLKSKNKKKEVLEWLQGKINFFESEPVPVFEGNTIPDPVKCHREKILLWNIVKVLVEYDGNLEGREVEQALRATLSPALDHSGAASESNNERSGIFRRSDSNVIADSSSETAIEDLRKTLMQGEREKAVWLAVDHRMWAHALLLASTLDANVWKQVSAEFVRQEVKAFGNNTESLAAMYQIFAGNGEDSMDELVPPSARAGLQLVSKASATGPIKNALDGLDRWRDTLALILSNRTPDDGKALLSLGSLLATYGRTEAAHICYIFANSAGSFGGFDEPHVSMSILGADHVRSPFDYGRDLDSILLTEVFDFARTILSSSSNATISPHIQPYKLYHALVLAEHGYKVEAQQYCDAISSALKSTTRPSPYYHPLLFGVLENLGERLRQAPRDGSGSWISKPSIDKVSGSIWAKFNSYVAGDESDAASTGSGLAHDTDAGPFARVMGESPDISQTPSSGELYNSQPPGLGLTPASSVPPNMSNSRYAPAGLYTPRSSLEQQRRPSQEQTPNGFAESVRSPYAPHSTYSRPTSSAESSSKPYKPTSQAASYTPSSDGYLPTPPLQPDYISGFPAEDSTTSTLPSSGLQYPSQTPVGLSSATQFSQGLSDPTTSDTPGYGSSPYEPSPQPQQHSSSNDGLGPFSVSGVSTYQTPETAGYQPSSYEPSSYEPSSYEPPSYEPPSYRQDGPQEVESPLKNHKKPSAMIDEDDDFEERAAAIRKEGKARKDHEADEAFRKAAEEDGRSKPKTKC